MEDNILKILLVCPEFFYPANTGGKVGILQKFEILSKSHELYLFCVDKVIPSNDSIQYIKKKAKSIKIVKRRIDFSVIIKLFKYPYCIASRSSKKILTEFNNFLRYVNPDLILYEFPQMAQLGKKYNYNKIIEFHNVEYLTLNSISKSIKNPFIKLLYKIESYRLFLYEKKIYKGKFNAFTYVSTSDIVFYRKKFNPKSIKAFGIFPPLLKAKFVNESQLFSPKLNMIFVANYSYLPNLDGAFWLVDKIMPKIIEKYNFAQLYIVGKNPSNELIKKSNNNVIVTGEVYSLNSYYELADIILVPIFLGGGIKIKLLEASSFGKLILSTTFGINGTYFDSNSILIADTEDDFIKKIIDVYNNKVKYLKYIYTSREIFKCHYDYETNYVNYTNFIEENTK